MRVPERREGRWNLESVFNRYQKLFSAVVSAVFKVSQLAQDFEPWLVGTIPAGVAEMADAFESQARLAIATTGFESAEEGRYTQLIGCSSQLRVAHRGAVEAARLLGLLDPTDAYEIRACLEGVGGGLETLATYTGGGIPRPADEKSREIRRLHGAVEEAGRAAFGSLAQVLRGGGDETLVRMGIASNLCLLICAEGLTRAATRMLEAGNTGTRETRLERLGGI